MKLTRAAYVLLVSAYVCLAQSSKLPSPKDVLGFNIGDDYQVASYTQLVSYWKRLAEVSPRIKLADIGPTSQGRRQQMAIISSPANLEKLDQYKNISTQLAHAELSQQAARELAKTGKAIVWIDGGLHASEMVGSQQLIETVYQLLTRNDDETVRILDDTIALVLCANPDGQDMVANWYLRESDPLKRSTANLPKLYHEYAGHDDNRDFYMSNLAETTNMNLQMSIEWFPQIVYDHHQTGPAGTVIFMPPFRDPINYNLDPLIPLGVESVGAAMHSRLVAEGKGGSIMRSGSTYSTWWNGGLRTIAYFHNSIGLLTEIIGNPTPIQVPLVSARQLPSSNGPLPIQPQRWHMRQSIEYELTNNWAVLDYASRNRETLLYNSYLMGRNSIDRGSRDSWTITPKRIAALDAATSGRAVDPRLYEAILHDPNYRDPRGYIIPADQPDFATATRFVNTLLKNGVTVMQAIDGFEVLGKKYPRNSYVVKTAQAFRPHILDMFEPQDHPNDFAYPGAPPTPPYDLAGWTLALQMGVKFDRVRDDFAGPFVKVPGFAAPPTGSLQSVAKPVGYWIDHQANNSFTLVNRLLKAGKTVYWMANDGTIWVPGDTPPSDAVALGLAVRELAAAPKGDAWKIDPVRIGLVDIYGGLAPTGWTRWVLEQYEFPYRVVYPQELDAGDLRSKFDVLVFPKGSIPANLARAAEGPIVPEEYRNMTGSVSSQNTLPQLMKFLESGGSVLTLSGPASFAQALGVPVRDYLTVTGTTQSLPREKFYVPGSLLRTTIDNTQPLAYGLPTQVDVMFDNSPTYGLPPDEERKGIRSAAWFANADVLSSGWAWGANFLAGGTAALEAPVGEGKLMMLGPEVAFRGQPFGSFKLLFNALHYARASKTTLQ